MPETHKPLIAKRKAEEDSTYIITQEILQASKILIEACDVRNFELIDHLLHKGINPGNINLEQHTILDLAAIKRNAEQLVNACENNNTALIDLLLNPNATQSYQDNKRARHTSESKPSKPGTAANYLQDSKELIFPEIIIPSTPGIDKVDADFSDYPHIIPFGKNLMSELMTSTEKYADLDSDTVPQTVTTPSSADDAVIPIIPKHSVEQEAPSSSPKHANRRPERVKSAPAKLRD